jgi:choline monooxygenase
MFALSGNPASMQVICARPKDAEHTEQTVDYFFAEDLSDEQIGAYIELSDLVTREDIVLCESVQRGLRSGAIKHGQLMLSRERGIQHFQKLVHRFMST